MGWQETLLIRFLWISTWNQPVLIIKDNRKTTEVYDRDQIHSPQVGLCHTLTAAPYVCFSFMTMPGALYLLWWSGFFLSFIHFVYGFITLKTVKYTTERITIMKLYDILTYLQYWMFESYNVINIFFQQILCDKYYGQVFDGHKDKNTNLFNTWVSLRQKSM